MGIFDKFTKKTETDDKKTVEKNNSTLNGVQKDVSEKKAKNQNSDDKKTDTIKQKELVINIEDKKANKIKTSNVYGVLIKSMVTEKANNLGQLSQYVFAVSDKANKIEVAKAIESRYGVKPEKVNILNNLGKKVRYGRNFGQRKSWKKAIVILPKGKTIKVHEGI